MPPYHPALVCERSKKKRRKSKKKKMIVLIAILISLPFCMTGCIKSADSEFIVENEAQFRSCIFRIFSSAGIDNYSVTISELDKSELGQDVEDMFGITVKDNKADLTMSFVYYDIMYKKLMSYVVTCNSGSCFEVKCSLADVFYSLAESKLDPSEGNSRIILFIIITVFIIILKPVARTWTTKDWIEFLFNVVTAVSINCVMFYVMWGG